LQGDGSIVPTVKALDDLAVKLDEMLHRVKVSDESEAKLEVVKAENHDNMKKLKSATEQLAKHMSTEIELQMSREELKRLQVENVNAKAWGRALDHCQLQLMEKENELKKRERQIDDLKHKLATTGDQHSHLAEIYNLDAKYRALSDDKHHVEKEKRRLEKSFTTANIRLEDAMQKNQELQKSLHTTQDNLEDSHAQIQRLLRTIVDMKKKTEKMYEHERHLDLLMTQVESKDQELVSSRALGEQNNKLMQDVALKDEIIGEREEELDELRFKADLAGQVQKNLDDERNKLREANKEIHTLKSNESKLVSQLNDLKHLEERNELLKLELKDCKSKVDKLPGLIGDISKLRALSRANTRAFNEQEATVEKLKKEAGEALKAKQRDKNYEHELGHLKEQLRARDEEIIPVG